MYKVFLVDDEIVIREGIRNNVRWEENGFALCGEAPDGEIALSMIQELKPDILITDIRMPFMDGLALCAQAARAMPWVHTLILSGYDDFAYAQEAISLGVREYLLKPVSAQQLEETLRRIAERIDQERAVQADLESIKRQLASSSRLIREDFLVNLIEGSLTGDVTQKARGLHMNLLARHYAVMLIEPEEPETLLHVRAAVERLADGAGGAVQLCARGGHLALLVLGDTVEDLEERAYTFAQAVKHEAERGGGAVVRVAIGTPVDALAELPASVEAAGRVLKSSQGRRRIMGVADMPEDMPRELMHMDVVPLYERLRYASTRDAEPLLDAYYASLGGTAVQSAVMGNYLLVDALLAAMRIIKQSGGDPEQVLPESLRASRLQNAERVVPTAKEIVTRALAFRDASGGSRYSAVIRQARAYIEENYRKPDIMLHDVAAHVALSDNHFCTVFSQEMGITFIEYLTRLRMERAKGLLKGTELRSTQIAEQVGYNDPHYFRYLFKKHMGMNPRDYRASCRAGREKDYESKE
jgi:two-component system response regulator YesN